MKIIGLKSICVALLCVSACTTKRLAADDIRMLPYYGDAAPDKPPKWPSSTPIAGLRKAVSLATPDRPVKLLSLHGMIVSSSPFSSEMQTEIAKELELVQDSTSEEIELFRDYEIELAYGPQPVGSIRPEMMSTLTRTVWREKSGSPPKLVVYEMLWAPVRDDVKYRYLGCFESRSEAADRKTAEIPWTCPHTDAQPNRGSRAWVNGWIKDGLMVRGFADAVIVNGAVGDILRDDLSLATCVMALDTIAYKKSAKLAGATDASPFASMKRFEKERCDSNKLDKADFSDLYPYKEGNHQFNLEYFVITHSLGSYFFFEAQARRELTEPTETRDTAQFLMFDNSTVFMFANQVSLLSLANLRAYCVTDQTACPNARMKPISEIPAGPGGMLTTYVAFNDADDDLGYELPPFLADAGLGRLINVTVHNPAFSLPKIFRWPGDVHTKQAKNPAIIDAIVNGITIPSTPPP